MAKSGNKSLQGWESELEKIRALYYSPYQEGRPSLNKEVKTLLAAANSLKPLNEKAPLYLGSSSRIGINFDSIKDIAFPQTGQSPDIILKDTVSMFQGLPNWAHPLALANICPQTNNIAVLTALLATLFSPNILEGEYAWNVARAELESAGMLAGLAGWDSKTAGGLYTYGGSGCWMYHLKYALSLVFKNSRNAGIRINGKVLCSAQAHYTMQNSTDWTGLGMDNIIKVTTDPETNKMDLDHLEEILARCTAEKIPVISVVCTMATTDANAFDPVKKVRALLKKYPNRKKYGKAFLYCDAVIGWAWLTFRNYDFNINPLGFSGQAIAAIKANLDAISEIKYADAFGVDFHKGYTPLVSSIFMYKNARQFEKLFSRPDSAYLETRTPYNPHNYTLEVSRSAAGSLAGWATIKSLGLAGFQTMLGSTLENKNHILNELTTYPELLCVNREDNGAVVLLRVYPAHLAAEAEYQKELNEKSSRAALIKHNNFIKAVGEVLWDWYRSGKKISGISTPYLSVTTGFRPATYNIDNKDLKAVVFALKIYPVNVFVTAGLLNHTLRVIRMAAASIEKNHNSEFPMKGSG